MRPKEKEVTVESGGEPAGATGESAEAINAIFHERPREALDQLFRCFYGQLEATIGKHAKGSLDRTELEDWVSETSLVLVKKVWRWEHSEPRTALPKDIVQFAFGVARMMGRRARRERMTWTAHHSQVDVELASSGLAYKPASANNVGDEGFDWHGIRAAVSRMDLAEFEAVLKEVHAEFHGLKWHVVEYLFSSFLTQHEEGNSRELKTPSERQLATKTRLSRRKVKECLAEVARCLKSKLLEGD